MSLSPRPLTAAFIKGRGSPGERPEDLPAELEALLRAALERGTQRWPQVMVTADAYAGLLGRSLAGIVCGDLPTALGRLALEDLYLACACVAGDPQAQRLFDEKILEKVPLFLSQLRMTESQIEEVRAALRTRLLFGDEERGPHLAGFQGQGGLGAFVRVAAVRAGVSLLRKPDEQHGRVAPEKALNRALARAADSDPELAYLQQRYRAEFQRAAMDAIGILDAETRGVLQLYYVNGVNTRQLAKLFNVNPTTASRWVADGRDRIAKEARRLLRERLRVSETEILSIYRVLRSQLDLSLRAVLGPAVEVPPTG